MRAVEVDQTDLSDGQQRSDVVGKTAREAADLPGRVHLVTALHACDPATDDAIALAIRRGADHVAVVPCCQAEVARQLAEASAPAPAVAPLFEHPWHRREFGSHLTNVLRALALEACGYKVTVTELTGWEHAVKNELILGRKIRASSREAREKLEREITALTRHVVAVSQMLFSALFIHISDGHTETHFHIFGS